MVWIWDVPSLDDEMIERYQRYTRSTDNCTTIHASYYNRLSSLLSAPPYLGSSMNRCANNPINFLAMTWAVSQCLTWIAKRRSSSRVNNNESRRLAFATKYFPSASSRNKSKQLWRGKLISSSVIVANDVGASGECRSIYEPLIAFNCFPRSWKVQIAEAPGEKLRKGKNLHLDWVFLWTRRTRLCAAR